MIYGKTLVMTLNGHQVVRLEFTSTFEMLIGVRDEGEGFDPAVLANPLAPENLLKSSGGGIFLIRTFMDDVEMGPAPQGGMEIRMLKGVHPPGDRPDRC